MKKHSRLQSIFQGMKTRCYDPNCKVYKNYGGRGITICEEWNNRERIPKEDNATKGYLAFKKWALENGYADNLSIDRIDVNGNYEPSNCRWITHKEQCNNTRRNHLITYKGKTQNLKQWCEELNISYSITLQRINTYNWSIEEAFETKGNPKTKLLTYKGKTQTLTAWSRELGIKQATLSLRLKSGWTVERALSKV